MIVGVFLPVMRTIVFEMDIIQGDAKDGFLMVNLKG